MNEHIVQAIGICLQSRPIMLALEFVNGGSLQDYLRRGNVRKILHTSDLLHIVDDVVMGCIYLEQEGYVHRDIAARYLRSEVIWCSVVGASCLTHNSMIEWK